MLPGTSGSALARRSVRPHTVHHLTPLKKLSKQLEPPLPPVTQATLPVRPCHIAPPQGKCWLLHLKTKTPQERGRLMLGHSLQRLKKLLSWLRQSWHESAEVGPTQRLKVTRVSTRSFP
jgi:hypothetical protein